MPSPLLEVRVSDQGFGFEFAHRQFQSCQHRRKEKPRGGVSSGLRIGETAVNAGVRIQPFWIYHEFNSFACGLTTTR